MKKVAFGIRMDRTLLSKIDEFANEKYIPRSTAIERLTATGLKAIRSHKADYQDNQDRESGAAAGLWGRQMGPRIARHFNGKQIEKNINVFLINGNRTAIKAARSTNTQIGIYNTVFKRIEVIWGAFQTERDTFEVFSISPKLWNKYAREAAESNPNHGKLTFLNISNFRKYGELIAEIKEVDLDKNYK